MIKIGSILITFENFGKAPNKKVNDSKSKNLSHLSLSMGVLSLEVVNDYFNYIKFRRLIV